MNDVKKKTILLVEDEAILAMTEKLSLEKYGYAVVIAYSGETAVETVKLTADIDLILMDINLGNGMDGTQTAEIILQNHSLPVVFLSSHTEPEIVEKTEKITSYGYVVKSSNITVLDASIKMAFKLFEAKNNEKKKEDSLLEAKQFNEQIIQSVNEGIIVYDMDLRYLLWNTFMENITGIPSNEIIGKHPSEVFPFLKESGVIDRLEKALEGESVDSIDFPYDFPEARKSGWTTDTSSTLRNTRGDIIGVIGVVSDITKRKQAEIKIQQDEKRFHLLFEKAPMGYQSLDFNGNFIEVNQQWLELLGYTRQEVIGKWFGDFLTPAYQDGFRERFPIFKAKGEIHSEFEMVKRDGDIIFIAFEGKIGYGLNGEFKQTHCLLQDITARKYFDIALQESEEKYRTLFERVGDAIFIYDPETFNILEANSATANLYNYTKDELLGMSCLKFSAEVEKSKSTAGRARDEGDARVVYRHHKTKDGKDLFVLLDVYKTEANGKEVMFAVVKNITKQKEAEEEINKQLSEKTILLQEVHHRMKNNIASIEGLLLMQLESTNNPQAVTAIQDAVARVQGMRILYQKLLIRSSDYQEISIKEYVESLINSITSIFPESSKITIKKQIIDFNLNVKVAVSIGIIINELFTNIFKYSFKDRNEGNVLISLDKVENQVNLIIQDDGVGMGVDFNINKTKGFGLSIVKMLTEQLNGRIVIENTDGTRSVITFKI